MYFLFLLHAYSFIVPCVVCEKQNTEMLFCELCCRYSQLFISIDKTCAYRFVVNLLF